MPNCELCCARRQQPCRQCGSGFGVCEPCLTTLEGLRCDGCRVAQAADLLWLRQLLLHCYQLRSERDDLFNIDPAVYDDDEPHWV